MPRKLTTRAGAAIAALFVLAMWLNPVIAVAVTSAPAETGMLPGQVHCADHSCCRKGHHTPVTPASQTQMRSSCCGGACCAFAQVVILKLGHFLPASPQMGVSFASTAQPIVRAQAAAVTPFLDSALFQRPPPSNQTAL
jgi:hypothetical protein